ncbi:hypothetical protein DEU38_10117 [Rhodococcus sp. AG1013]|uniref:hypothetical protein n=1 Tax=Rhodococcus sp. AG1013 TaxID=2183996 RepID=UPI000E0B8E08|nr:hypothetical protein [Rhodococcus sp. AG1013]RDI35541.1 hypothetical protein DEU38_10117 [Rhodococcus sp. AG1013]
MPRTQEHADRYTDALIALAAATHRPANVVNTAGRYAIRVDFEFNRYVLATNAEDGLTNDIDAIEAWHVAFFQQSHSVTEDELLAEAENEWLADAFDQALDTLRNSGKWIESDAKFGELVKSPVAADQD